MDKRTYLRETFGRMDHKTFENYVCNRIWSRIDNLDLKPVTQQYVKRYTRAQDQTGGTYALIDLYFPQIRFAIEVNEKYHLHDPKKDEAKAEDIKNAVEDIDCFEIWEAEAKDGKPVYLDIEDIHRQIDDAVTLIKAKIVTMRLETGDPLIWDDVQAHELKIREIRKRGILSVSDPVKFKITVDVLNELFDKGYKDGFASFGRTVFWFGEDRVVWFPPIDQNNRDWLNEYTGNTLTQTWLGEGPYPKNEKFDPPKVDRAVFAKQQDSLGEYAYRFIGIYHIDHDEGTVRTYKQVSKELPFLQWLGRADN
jgi:hypothetical protein